MDEIVDRFNSAATELQTSEFRRPRTPGEWEQMSRNRSVKNYAKFVDAVIPVIEEFEALGSPSKRLGFGARLNADALGVLRTYAYCASVLAVRRQSPVLIMQGLTALTILGEVDDVRDLTFYLATLHHAAVKLGIDPRKVFGDVASLSPSDALRSEMRGFPFRMPKDRDLRAFNLREMITDEGFDFVQAQGEEKPIRRLLGFLRKP